MRGASSSRPPTSKTSPPRSSSEIVDDDYGVLRRFKGASSLPTYLTVVARRICVKEVDQAASRGRARPHSAPTASVVDEDGSGEAEAIASAEEVERMLENLPEREAEVVRLYHLKYLNYRQIGKQLGIPENSVGPILAKARQRLRRAGRAANAT